MFPRLRFDEYDQELLQRFSFTSESYFPQLAGYVNVPRLNNAAPPEPGGDETPITFTLNAIFPDDLREPTADVPYTHLVIERAIITSYPRTALPRGTESREHTCNILALAWKKYWRTQLLEDYSHAAQRIDTYISDGGDPATWTRVQHVQPILDALNAGIA